MIACRAAAGCTRDLYARGLCQKHYFAERRAGAHTRDERYGCAAARFWSKVALPSGQFGCLEWQTHRENLRRRGKARVSGEGA